MRKQDAVALKLFISGLEGRWRENREYFTGIQLRLPPDASVLKAAPSAQRAICCAFPSADRSGS